MAIRDFTHSLPMLLYRAQDAVMPRFRRIFNEFGITEQQWRVLRVLAEGDDLAVRRLAELTLIAPPSLVGVVDRLQKSGFVHRRNCAVDRRRVLVTATAAGRELNDRIAPKVMAAYARLMQSVPPRDWIRLVEGLELLADRAGASGE
jgi:homoprotocatechuate degradation regulator HpaR